MIRNSISPGHGLSRWGCGGSLLLALAGCANPAFHAERAGPDAALLRDWSTFKAAQRQRDPVSLTQLINNHGYSPNAMKGLVAAYIDFLNETDADRRLSGLVVTRVERFEDQSKVIAFIRMRPDNSSDTEGIDRSTTQVAFSSDRGAHWRFNVQDCISENDLRRFSAAYSGRPALTPQ